MEWINAKKTRPKLGQSCLCYYRMDRYDNTIVTGMRVLFYLKVKRDSRKRVFSEKDEYLGDMNIGKSGWPVTHWMPLPDVPFNS